MDICQSEAVSGRLVEIANSAIEKIGAAVNHWQLKPAGSEGYRTAEVTLGGVDTAGLSSKTMQAKNLPGLFFIGEVVDVTGHLGGYNFQWAWSSGFVAGQHASNLPIGVALLGKLNVSDFKEMQWRRGRDSNPRNAQTLNGFQDRRFQPLSHPSCKVGANALATHDQQEVM